MVFRLSLLVQQAARLYRRARMPISTAGGSGKSTWRLALTCSTAWRCTVVERLERQEGASRRAAGYVRLPIASRIENVLLRCLSQRGRFNWSFCDRDTPSSVQVVGRCVRRGTELLSSSVLSAMTDTLRRHPSPAALERFIPLAREGAVIHWICTNKHPWSPACGARWAPPLCRRSAQRLADQGHMLFERSEFMWTPPNASTAGEPRSGRHSEAARCAPHAGRTPKRARTVASGTQVDVPTGPPQRLRVHRAERHRRRRPRRGHQSEVFRHGCSSAIRIPRAQA